MKTIGQLESEFEQKVYDALRDLDLLPEGYTHRVRFHGKAKDKKRTASADNFPSESDSIRIWFEPVESAPQQPEATVIAPAGDSRANPRGQRATPASDPVSDLVGALDRAEARPGYDFVALKWFRDAALPAEGFSWTSSDAARQNILRSAIERRLVLTSKVPNPKSPAFPVTAVRLNRLMPEVKAILGRADERSLDFSPVEIRGEGLSSTVLRERR